MELVDKEDKARDQKRRRENHIKEKMKLKKGRTEEDESTEEGISGSDGEPTRKRNRTKRLKIYFDSDGDNYSDNGERKDKGKLGFGRDSVSLEEQEAIALKLLSSLHS